MAYPTRVGRKIRSPYPCWKNLFPRFPREEWLSDMMWRDVTLSKCSR